MAVAMAVIISNHAPTLPEALSVVVLGGLMQVILGLVGIGRFVAYTSYVVVSGFMSGIGIIMLMTLGLTVFVGLVTAVAIGLIAAGVTHAKQLEQLELDSVVSVPILDRTFFRQPEGTDSDDPFSARVGLLALRGSFTVASSHKLVGAISADIQDHEVVIFDFSEATYLDDSAAMVIKQLMDVAREDRTELIVMGVSDAVGPTLQVLSVFRRVPKKQIVSTLDEARRVAADLLDR